MIGADDMAFPTLEYAELLVHVAGLYCCIGVQLFLAPANGAASGWTSYPPLSADGQRRRQEVATKPQTLVVVGGHVRRGLVHDGIRQLPDDDHPNARPGHDYVPFAVDDLGDVHHRRTAGVRSCPC